MSFRGWSPSLDGLILSSVYIQNYKPSHSSESDVLLILELSCMLIFCAFSVHNYALRWKRGVFHCVKLQESVTGSLLAGLALLSTSTQSTFKSLKLRSD